MVAVYTFRFVQAWDDAVYVAYPNGSPALKYVLLNAVTNINSIQARLSGILRMETNVVFEGETFSVGVARNQSAFDSWPAAAVA